MSAEVLRKAASLMRERAEAASDGPWDAQGPMIVANPGPNALYVADCFDAPESPIDATHIASWHPAVALAVADWLDDQLDAFLHVRPGNYLSTQRALAVARAYLGESS